jgi:hypothetical protein
MLQTGLAVLVAACAPGGGRIDQERYALEIAGGPVIPLRQVKMAEKTGILEIAADLESVWLQEWIAASLNGKHMRKDGSIDACDYDYKVQSQVSFKDALITEITFPARDKDDKGPQQVTVRLVPPAKWKRSTVRPKPRKLPIARDVPVEGPTSFRFVIDGVDCSKAEIVYPIVFRRPRPLGPLQLAVFEVEFPTATAAGFRRWKSDPKNGELEVFGAGRKPIYSLKLFGLRHGKEVVAKSRVRFKLSCSRAQVRFEPKG